MFTWKVTLIFPTFSLGRLFHFISLISLIVPFLYFLIPFALIQIFLEERGLLSRLRYLCLQFLSINGSLISQTFAQMHPLEAGQIFHAPQNVVEFWALPWRNRWIVQFDSHLFGRPLTLELHPAFGEMSGHSAAFLIFAIFAVIWKINEWIVWILNGRFIKSIKNYLAIFPAAKTHVPIWRIGSTFLA